MPKIGMRVGIVVLEASGECFTRSCVQSRRSGRVGPQYMIGTIICSLVSMICGRFHVAK